MILNQQFQDFKINSKGVLVMQTTGLNPHTMCSGWKYTKCYQETFLKIETKMNVLMTTVYS